MIKCKFLNKKKLIKLKDILLEKKKNIKIKFLYGKLNKTHLISKYKKNIARINTFIVKNKKNENKKNN